MKKLIAILITVSMLIVPSVTFAISGFLEPKITEIVFETEYFIGGRDEDGHVYIVGLTDLGKEQEELFIPKVIDGYEIDTVYQKDFKSDKLKRIILDDRYDTFGWSNYFVLAFSKTYFDLPNLEYINLDNIRTGYACATLPGMIPPDGRYALYYRGDRRWKEMEDAYVEFGGDTGCDLGTVGLWTYHSRFILFTGSQVVRAIHFADEKTQLLDGEIQNCSRLDYTCLGSDTALVINRTFSNCKNLRTVVLKSPNTTFSCYYMADDSKKWWDFNCKIDVEKVRNSETAYLSLYNVKIYEKNFERHISENFSSCVFQNCPKLTIIGYGKTQTEAYAKSHGIPFIPAIINHGEPSTVVAKADQTATVTINGVDIPAYTVNGSVYVGESALKSLGFTMDWDGEARTTTVTAPENVEWSVELNTNPKPYSIDVVSSDIEFWYKDFRIPVLNVGNGESIIDVNALAEAVLY